MAAKYNSMVIVFMVVMMILVIEQANGETSAECRDRCSQSCAMTGALPAKCLQSCYNRCHSLPSHTLVHRNHTPNLVETIMPLQAPKIPPGFTPRFNMVALKVFEQMKIYMQCADPDERSI
ncbi:hypothetical protein Bca52824_032757 [Brassica carinata]|uniref:Plant thionin family protein n=1 Tax=Brassica carinata TaxID=52824 RepID=A0A8X7SD04_BRACI|nr:hypothetical protein Bca52824_032757 [Brassica carinata]